MLRAAFTILLCLGVLAMPSYAAIRCAGMSGGSAGHVTGCCGNDDANTAPSGHEKHDDSSRSGGGQQCAVPCCGYVANVQADRAARMDFEILAALLPMTSAEHDSLSQGAIFHPPRV